MPLNFLGTVEKGWKAIGLIAAIFAAGLLSGARLNTLGGVPARVLALEARAGIIEGQLETLSDDVRAMREMNRIQLCLAIVERQHGDYKRCLVPGVAEAFDPQRWERP